LVRFGEHSDPIVQLCGQHVVESGVLQVRVEHAHLGGQQVMAAGPHQLVDVGWSDLATQPGCGIVSPLDIRS
jgi:hypothetical protein